MRIESADTLIARGNCFESIAKLTEANRERPDPDTERLLADLRLRGFGKTATEKTSHQPVWPPAYTDPFADAEGIPEIPLDELNLDSLAGGILDHGSVIVRNLFSRKAASDLKDDIKSAMKAKQAHFDGASVEQTAPWFAPPAALQDMVPKVEQAFLRQSGGSMAIDSPRAMFNVLEQYHRLGLKELLTEYFGEPPSLSALKWVLRCVPPLPSPADWHQDGAFMGSGVRSVNLWIALSHCGGDSNTPGLDLIPKRLNHIVDTGCDGARFDWSVGRQLVNREFVETPPVCPVFAPGDAVFFDHFNLHCTSYAPTMTEDRYAIECWFFASSNYAANQVPILF